MAADVTSLVRILSRHKEDRTVVYDSAGARSTVTLMTRDLLGNSSGGGGGGGGGDQSLELDLDLQVPTGWEKRLDLKSGKVYLQQCNSTTSSSSSSSIHHLTPQSNNTLGRFQDLNFPPNSSNKCRPKPLLSLFDDTGVELKLVSPSLSHPPPPPPPSSSSSSSSSYSNPARSYLSSSSSNPSFQSVCTLDKVKSALERAEKDPSLIMTKKRQSPDYTNGYRDRTVLTANATASSPVASGCPGCLSYVLVMKNNPKCPRCNSFVPLPAMKKPKIDLNISI